ncbi:solute carrier family 23 protein [Streptomyces hydrogenans]|uniref:solute carrier family 23 protein n=1 Tax=Streptomyces hydrogenans TaxID=1873719 RepID=UPI0036B6077F
MTWRTTSGSITTPPAEAVSTALRGGVLGAFTSTSYAQNVGLVSLSRIRSRHVVTLCGAILVLMGFVPVLGSLVALVPLPVLGGAGVVFFGSVAVTGIRTLTKAALGTGHNALIVSVTLAFGLFPVLDPDFYDRLPAPVATVLGSGITAGCLVAVLLNHLLNHLGRGTEADLDAISAEQVTALDTAGTVPGGSPAADRSPFRPSVFPAGTRDQDASGTAHPAPLWPYLTGPVDPADTHPPHEAPAPHRPSPPPGGFPGDALAEDIVFPGPFPGPFHPLHPRHPGPGLPRERHGAEAADPWQDPQPPLGRRRQPVDRFPARRRARRRAGPATG